MQRKHSSSHEAMSDLARAEVALERRREGGHTFRSIRVALGWYFAMKERLGNPKAARLTTGTDRDGNEVVIEADMGGRGSSLEDAHAALLTINLAINELSQQEDGGALRAEILHDAHALGKSQIDIARDRHMSQSTVSRELYAAENFLLGLLRGKDGVLR